MGTSREGEKREGSALTCPILLRETKSSKAGFSCFWNSGIFLTPQGASSLISSCRVEWDSVLGARVWGPELCYSQI